jgi:hypothetical protein
MIWNLPYALYNQTSFLRPVFDRTYENTVAHLKPAVQAYQFVNTIRIQLKANGIHHDWTHRVRTINAKKAVTADMIDKQSRKIYFSRCAKPEPQVSEIYNAPGYKYFPVIRKSVLPENEMRNSQMFVG